MYKEIREQINKVINWNKSLNSDKIISEEINNFIKENGFIVQDIYDVENVSGIVSALKLSEVFPIYLYEGIDFELDKPGGIILFSTDLNSTLGKAETFGEKVKFFFGSKFKTFFNRLNVDDRIKNILLDKYKQIGYTIGKNFRGAYKSKNGLTFNEKSFTIEIAGIDSDLLVLIATEICREFKQEAVMVRDFNRNKVLFVNEE
jgi:hypothetical protein